MTLKSKLKNKWLWSLAGALVVGLVIALWSWKKNPGPTYKEYLVDRGSLEVSILATGNVQPENRLEIKAPVAGRIDRVLVAEGDHVRKGQILAWMSSTERAALLDAARARGPEELKRWEDLYRSTLIMAPLPGTIILRSVEAGQTITAADAIFAMSDRLTVKAQVDETDLAKIQLHQKAEIFLDAYPDQKIPAVVDQIAYEAKTVSNVTTYIVDVLPEKTPEFLRAGMTANVRFFQQKKEDILLVNTEALTIVDGKTKALVSTDNGKPEEREIETGISDGKKVEVISGLEENDIVLRAEAAKGDKNSSSPFSPFGGGKRPPGSGNGGRR